MHFVLLMRIHINSRTEVLQQYLQFPLAGTSAQWLSLFPVINDVQENSPEKRPSSPALAEPFLPTLMALYQMLKHELIIRYIFPNLAICSHTKKKTM